MIQVWHSIEPMTKVRTCKHLICVYRYLPTKLTLLEQSAAANCRLYTAATTRQQVKVASVCMGLLHLGGESPTGFPVKTESYPSKCWWNSTRKLMFRGLWLSSFDIPTAFIFHIHFSCTKTSLFCAAVPPPTSFWGSSPTLTIRTIFF